MTKLHKRITSLFIAYILVGIFFIFINPEKMKLVYIFLPFLLIFGLLYWSIDTFILVFFSLVQSQRRIVSLVLSVMPVVLLVIQSITQLTIRDVVLCMVITVIIIWYISRSHNSDKQHK